MQNPVRSIVALALPLALTGCGAPRTALPGQTVPALERAQFIEHADPATPLHITVGLTPRNTAEREQLLNDLYDPSSPLFHQFLTNEEYTERFGPTAEEAQRVAEFLASEGFRNPTIAPNRLVVTGETSVAQAEHAFGVTLNRYLLADGRTAWANAAAPTLPSEVAPLVSAIFGLDSTVNFHPMWQKATGAPKASGTSPGGGYGPNDLANAYDLTTLQSTGIDGSGETVGVFELDGYLATDLKMYFKNFNVTPPSITNVYVDSASQTQVGGGGLEVELDLELLGGIASGASFIVYEGTETVGYQAFTDVYNRIVTDNKVSVVSISWGGCEADYPAGQLTNNNDIFMQGAAQGIGFFISSGDSGAYDCPGNSGLAVDFPGSSPYVTSVGGTTLTLDPAGTGYGGESAWGAPQGGASGGGISSVFNALSWQKGPGVANPTYPAGGKRQVPDVAANADPASGDAVYCTVPAAIGPGACSTNGWIQLGGTSASAPTWAATMALMNQCLTAAGKSRLGYANPALYALFNGYQDAKFPLFHDVTKGNNLFYPATAGYDMATGIGSADGDLLSKALVAGSNSKPSQVRSSGGGSKGCDVAGVSPAVPAGLLLLSALGLSILMARRRA